MSKNKKKAELNNTTEPVDNSSSDFVVKETKKEDKKAKENAKGKSANNAKASNKKKANQDADKKTLGQRTRATISELKKVTWPTFGQTLKQTGVVVGFVLIFVVLLLGLNSLFGWLFNLIVGAV